MPKHGTIGYKHGPREIRRDEEYLEGYFSDHLNTVQFFDDFVDDTLETAKWAAAVEADGTNPSTIAITEANYGTVVITLGAVANDFGNLASAKQVNSSAAGRLDVRLKVAGTPNNIFVGLSDAKTESNGNIVTNATTPTIVPDDAVGFAYDTANSGAVWWVVNANNTTDRSQALTAAPSSSFQKLSITWNNGGDVKFFIDDVEVAGYLDALRASQSLCLLIASTNVAGTVTPAITVDYVRVVQERA